MLRVLTRIWFPVVLLAAAVAAAAVAPACADDHFSIERIGEKGEAGGGVSWCQAKEVLSRRCWRCHHKDPENDAPFELCTYADTHKVYFGDLLIWQEMQQVVSIDFMPPVKLLPDVRPAVQPLDAQQKQTLLDWFASGAPLDANGAGGAAGAPATDPPCGTDVDAVQALCLAGTPYAEWPGAGGSSGVAGGGGAGGASGASSAGAGGLAGAGTAGGGG